MISTELQKQQKQNIYFRSCTSLQEKSQHYWRKIERKKT